jgi:putative redox protein
MKAITTWKNDLEFTARAGENSITLDTRPPLGKNRGPSPKELLLMGIGGCSGMDVISLLKKHRSLPKILEISVEAKTTEGQYPTVFEESWVNFLVLGDVKVEHINEAVTLSMTKYCGVSAMLADSFPIFYRVNLNGQETLTGQAQF